MKPANRLTPRERDVAERIKLGLTNREIGRDLGISEQTVKNLLTAIFDKLEVKSRLELALYLLRNDEA